jgi:hypothetical protein
LTVKGVKGVGLALEVGVRAGRLGNATDVDAGPVAAGSALDEDFEQAASIRTRKAKIKIRLNMIFPFSPDAKKIFSFYIQKSQVTIFQDTY